MGIFSGFCINLKTFIIYSEVDFNPKEGSDEMYNANILLNKYFNKIILVYQMQKTIFMKQKPKLFQLRNV
jgi:hypothetical protein